jgi:hypothetical protein
MRKREIARRSNFSSSGNEASGTPRLHSYVSHMFEYASEMIGTMKEIGKTGPFWRRDKS